eukprot:765088-Hanusia_phi.AAC.7
MQRLRQSTQELLSSLFDPCRQGRDDEIYSWKRKYDGLERKVLRTFDYKNSDPTDPLSRRGDRKLE